MTTELGNTITISTHARHKETHAMLEYLVAVNGLYPERLVNRLWKLNKKYIESKIVAFNKILQYFSDWVSERDDVMKEEGLSLSDVSTYYIGTQTHNNLLTMVGWFVGYLTCILNYSKVELFVPGLHNH